MSTERKLFWIFLYLALAGFFALQALRLVRVVFVVSPLVSQLSARTGECGGIGNRTEDENPARRAHLLTTRRANF